MNTTMSIQLRKASDSIPRPTPSLKRKRMYAIEPSQKYPRVNKATKDVLTRPFPTLPNEKIDGED